MVSASVVCPIFLWYYDMLILRLTPEVEHPRCPLPDIEPDDILAILVIAGDRE
jgi:hypothetical protein